MQGAGGNIVSWCCLCKENGEDTILPIKKENEYGTDLFLLQCRACQTVSGAAGVQQWLLIPGFLFHISSKGSEGMPVLVSAQGKMENMLYAEELVREFLVFRGFTNTLQAFDKELGTVIGKGFQVDKILDLIFSIYVPKFQAENLIELLRFFKQCFSSYETELISVISNLDVSILRYYIVYAIQAGRKDKVIELFDIHGSELLQKDQEWASWFAIPYIKTPQSDPQFRVYFSKEWSNALHLSLRNFVSKMFNGTRIPALMKISSERNMVSRLKGDIKQLNFKLAQLQALLEEKEAQLRQFRSNALLATEVIVGTDSSLNPHPGCGEPTVFRPMASRDICVSATSQVGERESKHIDDIRPDDTQVSTSKISSQSQSERNTGDGEQREEELSEVRVDFQETFLGHTSPISCCRFSATGDNVASASVDGTVRIWTYDSSAPASRNATIYCGAEIMSLEWECKSDRLLLIGTADGGIKVWNVDAKRVVCDLSCTEAFPSVLDLKCSPVEPIFVSAAASRGRGSSDIGKLGCASLTVWNMRTWKAMTVLPLGEDPPAITSVCFNHNGKLLAAAATDGMIHMFDMSAGLQITGWPAHDSAICSVLFGSDETSIFTLGIDGKIFEWSLQNQGKVLWSRDCSRLCNLQNSLHYKHEMALDADGRRLLVTSNSLRAPIYQVRDHAYGMRSLPHSASITTVDWHPTSPIFLTGSADHSVRVTSMA